MIGKNVTKFREKLSISQRELARRVGISGQMISKIENDLTNPSVETLNKIAATLGVTINDLLGIEDKKDPYYSNYLENYLEDTGYRIEYDEDNGSLFLVSDTAGYEITLDDIKDIKNSTKSFIQFKLSEVIKRSRKIGK